MWIRSVLPLALLSAAAAAPAQLDQAALDRLEKALAPWAQPGAPGGVLGVVQDGKLVYAKGFGLASLELNVPLSPQSAMDFGSVSKHFTSTAVLILEDEGKLSLDDDIRKHIPSVPATPQVITLRHLLTHTSGIRDYLTCLALAGWELDEPLRSRDALQMISQQRGLNFEPGKSWNYSNTGYFLASEVVRKVSGKSLGAFLEERVFKPLDMKSSHMDDDLGTVVPNRVTSYRKAGETWKRQVASTTPVGDGGLLISLEDFAKWDKALRSNALELKAPGHLARLTAAPLPNGYGLGLQSDKLGEVKRIGHGGDWLGFSSFYAMYPEKGISVISSANDGTQNGKSFNDAASRAIFGIEPPKTGGADEETPWTPEAFSKIEGTWTGGPLRLRIFEMEGRRMLQATGQPAFPLFLKKDETAFLKIVPLTLKAVKKDAKGKAEELELVQVTPGGPVTLKLTRSDYTPKAEILKKWDGKWWSPDLKTVFILRSQGSLLYLSSSASPEEGALTVTSDDTATLGVVMLKLVDGPKPTLRMDAGRANGFILERLD